MTDPTPTRLNDPATLPAPGVPPSSRPHRDECDVESWPAPSPGASAARPSAPPLILGGGLAGSALAILLARSGRPVTLIEQHNSPHHKVCGDFLSAEAIIYLRALGLDPTALGAVPIHTLRLATGNSVVETTLPFPAVSLTRFTLDEALLDLAATFGATVLRGSRGESLTHPEDLANPALTRPATALTSTFGDWQLRLASGQILSADSVFLATGKHDLRGHPRPAGRHNSLVAFKHYLRLDPRQHAALGSAIELTLFPHGYAGLQPVEPALDGTPRANLCLVVERDHLRSLGAGGASGGGTWRALLGHLLRVSPHLRRRIADAEPLLEQPLALSNIPYGLLRRSPPAPGLWPLGDQAAVIPSLTGDGMSIALHTAHLAAAMHFAGKSAADFTSTLYTTLRRQLAIATVASRLAVHPLLQTPVAGLAHLHPPLLQHLARATRIPNLTFRLTPDSHTLS